MTTPTNYTTAEDAAKAVLASQVLPGSTSNPSLVTDSSISNQCQVYLGIDAGNTYSRAIIRSSFQRTSIHCPTQSVTMQVSNLPEPDTTTDVDWFDLDSGNFVATELPFKWMRVKASSSPAEQVVVYVMSVHPTY